MLEASGIKEGYAVTCIGGGVWIDDFNQPSTNLSSAPNACQIRGNGWALASLPQLQVASRVGRNITNEYLWTGDMSDYIGYLNGGIYNLSNGGYARTVSSGSPSYKYRCIRFE